MATRCQLTRQPGRRWRTNGCWTCSGLLLCIISMLGMLARCAGSAETEALSGVDKQLNDALKQHCNAQRQIAITFTNKGYLDFALNWLHYVKELEVENYLIFALDSDAYQFLQEHQANTFYDPQLDQGHIDRRATDFGTDPFKKIVHLKPTLTLRVLELGYRCAARTALAHAVRCAVLTWRVRPQPAAQRRRRGVVPRSVQGARGSLPSTELRAYWGACRH
eukprot:914413-Rhodomonas_salina.4